MTDNQAGQEMPYLDGKDGTEGREHVRMKNTATMWLLGQGFEEDQITEELSFSGEHVDVAAECGDGSHVHVECETQDHLTQANISNSATNTGHQMFVLLPSGLYEMVDRRGYVYDPVSAQIRFPTDGPRVGRWRADGREPKVKMQDRHYSSGVSNMVPKTPAPEGYSRWKADGEEKRPDQPPITELIQRM